MIIFCLDEDVGSNSNGCNKSVSVQLERLPEQAVKSAKAQKQKMLKKHQCPKCKKQYQRGPPLRDHIRDEHPEVNICTFCNSVFTKASDFKSHSTHCNKHESQLNVQCSKCDFLCKSTKVLAVHDMMKHQPVSCSICKKVIGNKLNLKGHFRRWHEDRKIN